MFQSSLIYPSNFDFVLAEHDVILEHLRGELSQKHYCFLLYYYKQKLGLTHSNCPPPLPPSTEPRYFGIGRKIKPTDTTLFIDKIPA